MSTKIEINNNCLMSSPFTVNLVLVRTVKNNYFSLCTNY